MKRSRLVFLADYGPYGRKVHVRGIRGTDKVVVRCKALNIQRTFHGETADQVARGFAEQLAKGEQPSATPAQPTIAELWAAYCGSSDYRALRPKSRSYYDEAWRIFSRMVAVNDQADSLTVAKLEVVRTALEEEPRERTKRPYSVNTIRKALSIVKGVFAWGTRTEFLTRNRLYAFKFKVAKEQRPVSPDEYSAAEFGQLLAALSFDKLSQRTPFVLLCLCGYQGIRINAALHLRWEDVDWERDELVMQSAFDKMGKDWESPMRAPLRAVLARLWDAVDRPAAGWVFPAKRKDSASETYTVQSFWWALRAAEDRAKVSHRTRRAAHGLRRMIAGDIAEETGSTLLALEAIGDTGTGQAPRYIKKRAGRAKRTLDLLDKKPGVA